MLLYFRIRNCLTQLYAKDITPDDKQELDEALAQIEQEAKVQAVYVVDSFGSLYCENIDYLVGKYKKFLKAKEIGIHAHNNQQLGYANTIQGIIDGCNYVDATIYGIGRAAGNCPLELIKIKG